MTCQQRLTLWLKEVVEKVSRVGIGFMMAPMHHPAIKHVMPARQELEREQFSISWDHLPIQQE